jgi:hypothetical protein
VFVARDAIADVVHDADSISNDAVDSDAASDVLDEGIVDGGPTSIGDAFDGVAIDADATGGPTLPTRELQDELGQFWASNYLSYYRFNIAEPSRSAAYVAGVEAGGVVADPTGKTVFLFQNNPRVEGVFSIDQQTGNRTRLAWNLDLAPLNAVVVALTYVER